MIITAQLCNVMLKMFFNKFSPYNNANLLRTSIGIIKNTSVLIQNINQ